MERSSQSAYVLVGWMSPQQKRNHWHVTKKKERKASRIIYSFELLYKKNIIVRIHKWQWRQRLLWIYVLSAKDLWRLRLVKQKSVLFYSCFQCIKYEMEKIWCWVRLMHLSKLLKNDNIFQAWIYRVSIHLFAVLIPQFRNI